MDGLEAPAGQNPELGWDAGLCVSCDAELPGSEAITVDSIFFFRCFLGASVSEIGTTVSSKRMNRWDEITLT